jgi:hypothetical protein
MSGKENITEDCTDNVQHDMVELLREQSQTRTMHYSTILGNLVCLQIFCKI